MTDSPLTLADIIQMTLRDGENWAVAHARRLLELIQQIGVDARVRLERMDQCLRWLDEESFGVL